MAHFEVCVTRHLQQAAQELFGCLGMNDALLSVLLHILPHLLNQPQIPLLPQPPKRVPPPPALPRQAPPPPQGPLLPLRHKRFHRPRELPLLEQPPHLAHSLLHLLLPLEQPRATLRVRIRVQALLHRLDALVRLPQRVEHHGRDLHRRLRRARVLLQHLLQVAQRLGYLALLETAPHTQAAQVERARRRHERHADARHALVPAALARGGLGISGGGLRFRQPGQLLAVAAATRRRVVRPCSIPVRCPRFYLGALKQGALEAGADLENCVEVGEGLGGAAEGEVGRAALEEGEVVLGVAGGGDVVVGKGILRGARCEGLAGEGEDLGNGEVGGDGRGVEGEWCKGQE